jgi:hypothetical protein
VHHHLAQGGRSKRASLRQPAGMAAPRPPLAHGLGGSPVAVFIGQWPAWTLFIHGNLHMTTPEPPSQRPAGRTPTGINSFVCGETPEPCPRCSTPDPAYAGGCRVRDSSRYRLGGA